MAKRRKSKKKNKVASIDLEVVILIISSIISAILIYGNQGNIGQSLSSFLGGVIGWIKYLVPVALFLMAIYLVCEDKEYMLKKFLQIVLILTCIAIIMSIIGMPKEKLSNGEYWDTITDGYILGTQNKGGGAYGTMLAAPLVKLIGVPCTIILIIGVGIAMAVFVMGLKPSAMLADAVEKTKDNREENRQNREKIRQERIEKKREGKSTKTISELQDLLEDEITINMNDKRSMKKYEHGPDDLNTLGVENLKQKRKSIVPDIGPDMDLPIEQQNIEQATKPTDEENFFKQEQEVKEDKTKQVLVLEHTLTVEDENYEFPPIDLMQVGENRNTTEKQTLAETANRLNKTLYSFGVSAKVEKVSVGPAITRYELKPAEGVRVSKIANLADDIALNLAAESIRIEAPIPGKQAVGIEVPNKEKQVVHLRDIIDTDKFKNEKSKLAFALGKDVSGEEIVTDIAKMPHVLIAGSTGSGKSVCINTLITSILYKAKPSEVKLVMVDPKVVELSVYNGIPHLLIPVVTDPKKAAGALAWAVQEMVNRYKLFADKSVRDIKGYNEALEKEGGGEKLPQIVIIIDELADLMMVAAKDVEDAICRLAQMARAAGMHLVIATQRPSVDVITGIIKANVPSRIAFAVSSQVDSRTILDSVGAEKLLGKGDMLFCPIGSSKPTRIQGAFVSDKEVESIVEFLKSNFEPTYSDDILEKIEKANSTDKEIDEAAEEDDTDPFLMEAIDLVVETRQASTSFIQRRFKVGYARAGRIMDQMEQRGVISGYQGSKPREVLLTKEKLAELKMAKPIEPQQIEEQDTEQVVSEEQTSNNE